MNIERIPKNGPQFSSSRRGKGRNLFGNDDMAQTSWTQIGNKREGGRGRHRTSPGRCLTIHYLNQRHACLPSLCATCKYSGRRRCSTRVDENRRCVYTQAMTATMMAERGSGCHPANSIPFLYIGRVTLRKFVNAALVDRAPAAIVWSALRWKKEKILAAFAALFIHYFPSSLPLWPISLLWRRFELSVLSRNLHHRARTR